MPVAAAAAAPLSAAVAAAATATASALAARSSSSRSPGSTPTSKCSAGGHGRSSLASESLGPAEVSGTAAGGGAGGAAAAASAAAAAAASAEASAAAPLEDDESRPAGETLEVSLIIEFVSVPLLHPLLVPNLNESTAARKRAELSFRALFAVFQLRREGERH